MSKIYIQYAETCKIVSHYYPLKLSGKKCDPVASQAEEAEEIFKINETGNKLGSGVGSGVTNGILKSSDLVHVISLENFCIKS